VKIIDIDLERRRISLSIKQAAEGGVVAAEYQDQFGDCSSSPWSTPGAPFPP
jgi:small subunit ribosomal protein S1